MEAKREVLLQITAGQGPAECVWAVVRTLQELLKDAAQVGFAVTMVHVKQGPENGTAYSVLVSAQSPFRPKYKRKNWLVGVEVFEMADEIKFDAKEITWETMRARGPGGQHVNRTECVVRVTHVQSGMQAVASEELSQHSNRRLGILPISESKRKLMIARGVGARNTNSNGGNPVQVFRYTDVIKIR